MTQKPKLGIDVDETLVWLLPDFLDWYKEKHGTNYTVEDFHTYHWWEVLGIKKEQAYAEMDEYSRWKTEIYEWVEYKGIHVPHLGMAGPYGIEFVPGAFQAVNLLHIHYDLYAITDRNPLLENDTAQVSSVLYFTDDEDGNYFPEFRIEDDEGAGVLPLSMDRVYHTDGRPKSEVCKELGIQRIVDDNADVAVDCAQNGIHVIVLARPWNQNMPKHELIDRVEGWQEACNLLVPGNIKIPEYEARISI